MKIFIEDYREHKIWYNEDTDKFTVELLIDNDWGEKSRKSLKDCRSAIDSYIKDNLDFKPITAIRNYYGNYKIIKIESVRSDGGFIYSYNGKKETCISEVIDQIKGKKNTLFNFDLSYIDWMGEKKKIEDRHKKEIEEINNKKPELTPLDLSFVKQFMKP